MIADKIYEIIKGVAPCVIGDLPSDATNIVAIMDNSGETSTEYFGQTNSTIYSPVIQIVIRSNTYEWGSSHIEQIKEMLHRYHDDYFLSIMLVGDIMYLGRNTNRDYEFQLTFNTQIKE